MSLSRRRTLYNMDISYTKKNIMATENTEKNHPIQVVARYTGLNPELIRAWEKRYRLVKPARTKSGRRLYSDADIEYLSLLRKVTRFGRRISEVANLPIEKLTEISGRDEDAKALASTHRQDRLNTGKVMEYFDRCTAAIVKFDTHELQTALQFATEELDVIFLLEDLLSPLQKYVAEECREGELLNCHHTMFTEITRSYLIALSTKNNVASRSLVSCSMIQDPMLTAAKVASVANHYGWNTIYLGESIGCIEIVNAINSSEAHVVALSFDDSREKMLIPNEMKRLASMLPYHTQLIVNAPDTSGYLSVLGSDEAVHVKSFGELRLGLERLETSKAAEKTTSEMMAHFLGRS